MIPEQPWRCGPHFHLLDLIRSCTRTGDDCGVWHRCADGARHAHARCARNLPRRVSQAQRLRLLPLPAQQTATPGACPQAVTPSGGSSTGMDHTAHTEPAVVCGVATKTPKRAESDIRRNHLHADVASVASCAAPTFAAKRMTPSTASRAAPMTASGTGLGKNSGERHCPPSSPVLLLREAG